MSYTAYLTCVLLFAAIATHTVEAANSGYAGFNYWSSYLDCCPYNSATYNPDSPVAPCGDYSICDNQGILASFGDTAATAQPYSYFLNNNVVSFYDDSNRNNSFWDANYKGKTISITASWNDGTAITFTAVIAHKCDNNKEDCINCCQLQSLNGFLITAEYNTLLRNFGTANGVTAQSQGSSVSVVDSNGVTQSGGSTVSWAIATGSSTAANVAQTTCKDSTHTVFDESLTDSLPRTMNYDWIINQDGTGLNSVSLDTTVTRSDQWRANVHTTLGSPVNTKSLKFILNAGGNWQIRRNGAAYFQTWRKGYDRIVFYIKTTAGTTTQDLQFGITYSGQYSGNTLVQKLEPDSDIVPLTVTDEWQLITINLESIRAPKTYGGDYGNGEIFLHWENGSTSPTFWIDDLKFYGCVFPQ